jgi:hypothetical protein
MKLQHCLLSALLAVGLISPSFAAPILSDLTTADYITVGGLDWAWAGPVATDDWGGDNYLFEASLHAGWREATDLEWFDHPDAVAFGTKCASAYWNSSFTHCDWTDNMVQHRVIGGEEYSEIWYVRSTPVASDVPEPGSLALSGAAMLMLAASRKKKVR